MLRFLNLLINLMKYGTGHLHSNLSAQIIVGQRIMNACKTIRIYPGICELVRKSEIRLSLGYIKSHGGYSEHFL
jgi:hypothetical protein